MPIQLLQGDITRIPADAIVNAANSALRGGGGVDGAIHRAGGPAILAECRQIGHCPTGGAVITTAGELPAHYVIHAVGPVWQGGNNGEDELLASAYRTSLQLALSKGLKRVSFPNISTGTYGFPRKRAAQIAIGAVRKFLRDHRDMEVLFVCFDDENHALYTDLLSVDDVQVQ